MTLKDLRLYLHLCQSLHFGRTSDAFHISPSSLSRSIRRLEQEAGAVLFERDNRTVQLTRAGALFRDYAGETLTRWSALQHELHQREGQLQGRLSVFCSVTASYSFLHDLLDAFRSRYPAVEIHLHTGDSALAVQRVLQENDDLAIAARPDRLPRKLQFQVMGESPLVFIAPRNDCELSRQLQQARAAGQEYPWSRLPFIIPETGLARSRVDHWFREQGLRPEIYARISGNEAIVSMVSLGFGVGVAPLLVVENSPIRDKVEVLQARPELEPFSIGLCCLRRKLSSPLIRALWDLSRRQSAGGPEAAPQRAGRSV